MANMLVSDLIDLLVAKEAQSIQQILVTILDQLDFTQWGGTQLERIGTLIGHNKDNLFSIKLII